MDAAVGAASSPSSDSPVTSEPAETTTPGVDPTSIDGTPTSEPATSTPASTSEPDPDPTSGPVTDPTSDAPVDPTSEPVTDPTSGPAPDPTSGPVPDPTSDTPLDFTSEGASSTAAPVESSTVVDTGWTPDLETTQTGDDAGADAGSSESTWIDGGAPTSVEPTTDAGVDVTSASPPDEYVCGRPLGMPESGDPGDPGEWPLDEVDSGAFDSGVLVNGSFDTDLSGWTSQANPLGWDTGSTFYWEPDGARAALGAPWNPNAQVLHQDFTVPSNAIGSAAFAFDVVVYGYGYDTCLQDVDIIQPLEPHSYDAFRVDIIASDAPAVTDAGADGGAVDWDVFNSPILFEVFAPTTLTYGVQHVVVDTPALADFFDSRQGETLRLRISAVSSNFPVMGAFDNVSLHIED